LIPRSSTRPDPDSPDGEPEPRGVTRRRALTLGGGALGLAAAAGAGFAGGRAEAEGPHPAAGTVPYFGEHQAGIATPAQDRLVFGAFDLTSDDAVAFHDLLRAWSDAAALMTQGNPTGTVAGHPEVPPSDTGEAEGLAASQLTITFGFGRGVFERGGEDRMGLQAKMPASLRPLGPLPGDSLDPGRSDGDLCVQACANDPQVAFHAIRNLARIARPTATLRWTQLGFGRTSTTSRDQSTPRNLMGFKDGTRNIKAEDTAAMDRFVWVGGDESQRWMHGGTYLVARRIRMLIESWDRDRLGDQEAVFGRAKVSGAPLTGSAEFDTPDLRARDRSGQLRIGADAHIRLAAPQSNGGASILRRGYSYTDGIDTRTGLLDAGLFFICFQRDPQQFVEIQRRLGTSDALNEYIQHTGSGLFAVPPGARRGGFVGEGLFGA
jgi:deferrochelatase/peroxidase EfeB